MSSAPTTIPFETKLSKGEQEALVNLLADEDPAVYRAVKKRILACGPDSDRWLRPHALSNDPILRRHVRDVRGCFHRQHADNQFLSFCLRHGEEFAPEPGAWLLAKTAYPDINVEAYEALLDGYAAELRERIDFDLPSDKILTAINRYLFKELGFSGNEVNYYEADNSYLNRVLDRRTGNPITLSLLYMLLAKRLQLPIVGIGLPGHFICRYQSTAGEFYVDPFNGGQLLTKADCVQFLQRGNHSLSDDFLAPVTARRMFLRICSSLHQIYSEQANTESVTRFQRYLVALAR